MSDSDITTTKTVLSYITCKNEYIAVVCNISITKTVLSCNVQQQKQYFQNIVVMSNE